MQAGGKTLCKELNFNVNVRGKQYRYDDTCKNGNTWVFKEVGEGGKLLDDKPHFTVVDTGGFGGSKEFRKFHLTSYVDRDGGQLKAQINYFRGAMDPPDFGSLPQKEREQVTQQVAANEGEYRAMGQEFFEGVKAKPASEGEAASGGGGGSE